MKNSEAWADYTAYTKDLSEQSRKLAFAAIGVCWVLRPAAGGLPELLLLSLLFTAAFFLFDLLQYSVAAFLLKRWVRTEELRICKKTGSLDGEVYLKPKTLDLWPMRLALVKHLSLLAALAVLVSFVVRRVFSGTF